MIMPSLKLAKDVYLVERNKIFQLMILIHGYRSRNVIIGKKRLIRYLTWEAICVHSCIIYPHHRLHKCSLH